MSYKIFNTELSRILSDNERRFIEENPAEAAGILKENLSEIFSYLKREKSWMEIEVGHEDLRCDVQFIWASKTYGSRFQSGMTESAGKLIETVEFQSSLSSRKKAISLHRKTTRGLIGRSGSFEEVAEAIRQKGGRLLPAEAGPQFCWQRFRYRGPYPAEFSDLYLLAMEPINGEIFTVRISEYHDMIWRTSNSLDTCPVQQEFPADCIWLFGV
jgi:hypothetical protein